MKRTENATQIGFDTLHIEPAEYTIYSHFQPGMKFADAKPGQKRGADLPVYTVNNETVYGKKAYINTGHFRLDLSAYQDEASGMCHVLPRLNLTIPKIIHDDNFNVANLDELKEALKLVEDELKKEGFGTNLNNAIVRRCDIAKTLQLADKWPSYNPALSALEGSRMTAKGFETGKTWGNGRRQICMYEKGLEIASKLPKKQQAACYAKYPKNSIRAELRLTQPDSFLETTGLKTAGDILSSFDTIESTYRSEMEKKLFRFTPAQIEKMNRENLSVEAIADELLAFMQAGERFWLDKWITADWTRNRVQDADRLKVLKAAIKLASAEANLPRQNVLKQTRRLDSLFIEYAATADKKTRTVGNVYTELQTKILS